MGLQHGRYDSPAKLSTKRSASCLSDDEDGNQDEPAQVRTRKFSVDTSSPVLHEFEKSLPTQPTPLGSTVPEESEPADLMTPDPVTPDIVTPDPLTPDPVAPNKSIWATLLASLGFRSLAGSVNKNNENHKDRHRPELKNEEEEEEEKPTKEINAEMAAKRHNKKPLCKYGTHRKLDRPGDDVKNKVCKFHKSRKGEDKKEEDYVSHNSQEKLRDF
ncbi:hypothetical protein J4E86_010237 [Alternaria arbusti]|uniref:uncharacterized protein n=1 Tax=Alternaria arbusti TaxID=232088 RepID=UPI00221ECF19|nr:uncharacterized protein J4E86_010237 [Alternaria arbusti]KAI4942434.1 hypothetical protein J4E86_010237 [Alternaria arbusti]